MSFYLTGRGFESFRAHQNLIYFLHHENRAYTRDHRNRSASGEANRLSTCQDGSDSHTVRPIKSIFLIIGRLAEPGNASSC